VWRRLSTRLLPRRLAHGEEATLVEHLEELRSRLIIALFAIIPAFLIAYAFHDRIIEQLIKLLPEGTPLVTFGVTEPFVTSVKVSFYVAIAIALPILLWQLWAFLAPATNRETQRVIGIFVAVATGLFVVGVMFCYVIILPAALEFLLGYDDDLYDEQVRASYFLSFVTLMLLVTGLAFELPIFILALVRLGVASVASLRRNRRIAYALMLVVAILLPTVDPVSLALEFVPLVILFEGSVLLAAFMERRWARSYRESFDTG
jgi:sec-independent protein translocase protein TatC